MHYEEWLMQELATLSPKHRIAFAASCAERVQQNYRVFTLVEKWGDADRLYSILSEIWDALETSPLRAAHIQERMQVCLELGPDTDDFSSLYGTLGMRAGEAVYCTLLSYLNHDVQNAMFASRSVIESLDAYLQTVNDPETGGHSHDAHFDAWIMQTPLMLAELDKQKRDLATLKSAPELSAELLRQLRHSSTTMGLQLLKREIVRIV